MQNTPGERWFSVTTSPMPGEGAQIGGGWNLTKYLVQGQDPKQLDAWAEVSLGEAMMLLTKSYGRHPPVRKYVMKCLGKATDDELVFWLPQIVQSLRTDSNDAFSLRKYAL